eukprot:488440_1
MTTHQHYSIHDLIPYLTWRAPFGTTGILPLISQIIALYCPNDIIIKTKSILSKESIVRIKGYIDPTTHDIILIFSDIRKSEIIAIPNYQISSECIEKDIWTNQINYDYNLYDRFTILNKSEITSTSLTILATKKTIAHMTKINGKLTRNSNLNKIYGTSSENPIVDLWVQLNHKNTHFILKRALNSSYAEILELKMSDSSHTITNKLYRFVLSDDLIVNQHCCYVLNDMSICLIYHKYDFLTSSCKLALRCCSGNNTVFDIEIPFHLLNDTYSKTLSVDKVYIMNIAEKYFFYHKAADQYVLFMDLTYRFDDFLNNDNGSTNSMQFKSSVFMWQFQIDWTNKKIKNIAIAAVKIDLSLSGICKYRFICFDEENGSVLLHEKHTLNFIIKRLADIIQKWHYYLQ